MTIITEKFNVSTKGFTDIIDITNKLNDIVGLSGVSSANASVYVIGSTASITSLEFEPGLVKDLPEVLETIVPLNKDYHHNQKWHDGNGAAHIRAAIIGNSINIPVINGSLFLGTWQQVVLIDFDNKPRARTIVFQLTY